METTTTIAIIGAIGKTGADLAKRLVNTGSYRLLLISEDEKALHALQSELGPAGRRGEIETMTCARDASWEADIIVVMSTTEEQPIAEKIRDVAVGKIVVQFSALGENRHRAANLQRLLLDSQIVHVCQAGLELDFSAQPEVLLSGNNGGAVEATANLLRSAGFDTTVTGDLVESTSPSPGFFRGGGVDLDQVLSYWRSMTRAFR